MGADRKSWGAQVAFEFLIVYSFVLIIFILLFAVIATQRAATLGQEQYSLLQIQSQNIAGYIDQAVIAGTGYSAIVPLAAGFSNSNYNLSISSTGVIITKTVVGTQTISTYAFSDAKSMVVNGTLKTSANSINIYQVPTYRGSITISNLEGTIYIDTTPPPISSIAEGAVVTQPANVKTMLFDNVVKKGYVAMNNSNMLALGSPQSVSFWVYANGCGTVLRKPDSIQLTIDVVSSCTPGYHTDIIYFNYTNAGRHTLGANIPSMSWINIVATYSTANGMAVYINGTAVTPVSVAGSGPVSPTSNILVGNGDALFNGSVANLQVYNGILSAAQVSKLYISGIGGMPINSNLIGWWPLDGNANDYSGFGNSGVTTNSPQYASVVQLNAQVYSLSGNLIANALVGFVSSIRYLNGNSAYSSSYTNAGGVSSSFVMSSGTYGSGNVITDLFKGNGTSLVGWWPLDTGYGTNAIDLSKNRDTGNFVNGRWSQYVNQTNFIAPDYPPCNSGCPTQSTWVISKSSPSLFNIVNNATFTAILWLYQVPGGNYYQGIFGNWNNSNGFQFEIDGNCPEFYIASTQLGVPCGAIPNNNNNWTMVVMQYNGATGAATVYANSNVVASGTLPENLPLGASNTPYEIGFDTSSMTLQNFDGLISNIQLYDTYLTQQQINYLFRSGLADVPLGNSGLLAWWPMINNPTTNTVVDYSSNHNNATENSLTICPPGHINQGICPNSITYINAAYNNTWHTGPGYATFNGFSYVKIPYTSKLASVSNSLTVSFWFASSNRYSSNNLYQSLLSVETSSGGTGNYLNLSLCGTGPSCSPTGITGYFGNNIKTGAALNFGKNTWYSVTETFSPNTWVLYIDGSMAKSGSYATFPSSPPTSDYLYFGSGPGTSNFIGQMADFQVYNSALTPQQAEQLYLQGLPAQYAVNISVG